MFNNAIHIGRRDTGTIKITFVMPTPSSSTKFVLPPPGMEHWHFKKRTNSNFYTYFYYDLDRDVPDEELQAMMDYIAFMVK